MRRGSFTQPAVKQHTKDKRQYYEDGNMRFGHRLLEALGNVHARAVTAYPLNLLAQGQTI